MEPTIIGIDVSKDRLDVHVRPSGETFTVARNAVGLDQLVERLRALAPQLVALEATGGFEVIVAAALAAAGLPVVVVNPAQIRAFAKALGQRAKTDPIDAGVIARFAEATRPAPRPLPDQATRLLADLVTRRRQIVAMITAERQRERHFTAPRLKRSAARLIAALERELADLAPFTRQSGQGLELAAITGGRAPVRAALLVGAIVARRHNPALRTFFQRLRDAGKPRMVALIAVTRKLPTILNAILRDRRPWQYA
jgi:transposase